MPWGIRFHGKRWLTDNRHKPAFVAGHNVSWDRGWRALVWTNDPASAFHFQMWHEANDYVKSLGLDKRNAEIARIPGSQPRSPFQPAPVSA